MRYVIYDTETTGTDTTFDQILQFAAVQTDDELNVVEELDIRCRLLPHVVPSPEAMLVTGVPAGRLTDPMLPSHHEMVVTIHKTLLAWSPATFLGWNSLSFDELLLREAFYQNLFPPFLTNVNGNRRSDLLRMARAAAIVAPGTLAPATSADGNPSFKLDRLAPANGFTHDQAHDALADVRATLHLARLIKPKAPAVWSAFMRFGHKANVLEYLHAHRLFGFLPCRSTDTAALIGTTIGALPRNPAALLFQDLTVSAAWLCELSDDRLAKRLQQFPRPIHQLKTNESPFLLTPDEAAPFHRMPGINLEELKRRAQFLKANPAVRERLTDAVATLYPAYDPSPHVEQQIYDGFFSREDQIQLNRFHDAAWQERPALVQQFEDPRLRRLGQRLLFLERPDVLPRETRQAFAKTMHERLKTGGETGPWRTRERSARAGREHLGDNQRHPTRARPGTPGLSRRPGSAPGNTNPVALRLNRRRANTHIPRPRKPGQPAVGRIASLTQFDKFAVSHDASRHRGASTAACRTAIEGFLTAHTD